MNPQTQTIELEATTALTFVQRMLPMLEGAVPVVGAAAGPIGMGVSAAVALTPILIRFINKLAEKGLIDAATQLSQLERVAGIIDCSGDQWKVQPPADLAVGKESPSVLQKPTISPS